MRFAILKDYHKKQTFPDKEGNMIEQPDSYPADWTFHLIAEDGRIWTCIDCRMRQYILCHWHEENLDFPDEEEKQRIQEEYQTFLNQYDIDKQNAGKISESRKVNFAGFKMPEAVIGFDKLQSWKSSLYQDFDEYINKMNEKYDDMVQVLFGNGKIEIRRPQAFQIDWISVEEYAVLHNKSKDMVKLLCREDRIEAIKGQKAYLVNRFCPWAESQAKYRKYQAGSDELKTMTKKELDEKLADGKIERNRVVRRSGTINEMKDIMSLVPSIKI